MELSAEKGSREGLLAKKGFQLRGYDFVARSPFSSFSFALLDSAAVFVFLESVREN